LQVRRVGRQHTAFALYRLDDYRAGLVGDSRLQCLDIVERHVGDTGRVRAKAFGVLGLATYVHGKHGTAVEGVGAGNDFVLVGAVVVGSVFTRQLEGRFVGFGTGVTEEHALGKGLFYQRAGQLQGRFVGKHIRHVPQLAGLLGQGSHHFRVAVAQRVHGNATGQVDEFAALLVPHAGAFSLYRDKTGRAVVGHHDLVECVASDSVAH